ncbi:MAG: ATP synthase F1 subcomplex gamma subunit [Parcubacteria group bacterium Gr01-1014_70]|nr:MAG: ATP synthase F1 subcomplex gamma subunit [Parcubacteria group bacterium Gr01-1014_70]
MQSLQTIKRRLRGVKSIGQITKAMELVAATKMRRSQTIALASRPYVYAALELLANLSRVSTNYTPMLLQKRLIKTTAVVVIASDKGLTGSFNSAVFRAFEKRFTKETFGRLPSEDIRKSDFRYIAVGQKAVSYVERRARIVEQAFTKFGDITTLEETRPLADLLVEGYLDGRWDKVSVLYTNFKSALQQEVITRDILPVDFASLKRTAEEIIPQTGRFADEFREKGIQFFTDAKDREKEYIIEPSPKAALDMLVPYLVVMQVYHIILEANASEHAARRLAMKNASDNAADIVDTLTLEYNKSRQAGITKELLEVTAGAEALT